MDLADEGKEFVSVEEAERMRSLIGAEYAMECSALKMEGINDAFEKGIKVSLDDPLEKSECPCTIL
jgi:hypothetical protein